MGPAGYHYQIEISADISSREHAREGIGYDDFSANLFINGAFVADISFVLATMESFIDEVDATDWEKEFMEQTGKL